MFSDSGIFPGFRENVQIGENCRNLRNSQSRGFERPRRSCSQHSNPGGARCLSSASVAQMLAAASIKVMDALFGLVARNDAQCCKREFLGRSWRQDWAMPNFQLFFRSVKEIRPEYFFRFGCCGIVWGFASFVLLAVLVVLTLLFEATVLPT